jgi:hypothetical protein
VLQSISVKEGREKQPCKDRGCIPVSLQVWAGSWTTAAASVISDYLSTAE